LVLTDLSLPGIKALTNIANLLVHAFQFVLARSELRLKLGASLLTFRSACDGLTDVDNTDFRGAGGRWSRSCLCSNGRGAEQARRHQGSGTNNGPARSRTGLS